MSTYEEIDELKERHVCCRCVGDEFLAQQIESLGARRKCFYCSHVERSFSVEAISKLTAEAFEQHFVRTPDNPSSYESSLQADKESDYEWYRDGYPVTDVIVDAVGVSENIARDIQCVLEDEHQPLDSSEMGEEREFSTDSHYIEAVQGESYLHDKWHEFERILKTETRFFNREAFTLLESIFKDLNQIQISNGKALIRKVGPGEKLNAFFRARTFQSHDDLENALKRPDLRLASPPSTLAKAGRLNSGGISVFYGATSAKVAVAEVRPPVGSEVVVASFKVTRPLTLLDLTVLERIVERGSFFDPAYKQRLERAAFLKYLSQRMTRPVLPNDESLEYLPTQAVADFLATLTDPELDGILYPSVQSNASGLNVMLFHKASAVKKLPINDNVDISVTTAVHYEDGWEQDYSVYVWSTEESDVDSISNFESLDVLSDYPEEVDGHEESLELDLSSIEVCIVKRVDVDFEQHAVSWIQGNN